MTYWVAQTQVMREHLAIENLKRDGYEVYAPRIKLVDRGRLRVVPLFPAYIFIRTGERWSPVIATVGIVRLLGQGERPATLEDAFVNSLIRRELDGFVALPKPHNQGDTVRVTKGAFAGHLAIYQGMTSREREQVLLEFLGRKVRLDLDRADIEAVNLAELVARRGNGR